MGQTNTSADTGPHQAGTIRSANSSQQPAVRFLSDCLTSDKGNMQLNIPGDVLPQFLIEANSAVNANRLARAGELINTENIEVARRMATENPSHGDVIYLLLGVISQKLGRLSDALSWYKKILENQPNALVANEIATIYQKLGRYSRVLEYRQKAVEIEPDNIGIWTNYAVDLIVLGKPAEGIDLLRRAVERNPAHPSIHSNLLWYTNYLPGHDARQLFEDHKLWGQTHAPPYLARASHANDPDPDRRLRIGYICPDFRGHPTANTFEQFLRGHDRNVVEVYGYGNVAKPDEVTAQLKRGFDHYRNIYGTDDDTLAEQIEADTIDILVEIGGHVANNRLLAMARKPAPIQVDYGGINTTGMEQVDYRLSDRLLSPPHLQKFFVEELVCLPGGLYCFKPPDCAPPVAPLPAERKGYVTFGSFNGALKTNAYIVSIWAEVLKANEGSRFLMKIGGGDDELLSKYYFDLFERCGVARDRVEIHNWKPRVEHLQLYGEVDIVLDTFPVNGAMTMLEGLWMGVPAVSLIGKYSFLARMGLSILAQIGLEFFAASNPDEFVAKATALARNLPAMAKIRASMRQRIECSPLRDAQVFARGLEDAYRMMWRRWCRSRGVDVPQEDPGTQAEVCAGGFDQHPQDSTETPIETLEGT